MSRAQEIATALLSATEHSIVPLTAKQVSQGSKLFGAAVLDKASLSTVLAETNNERESPLLHGEINCIQQFFKLPKEGRPETKDCIFFAVSLLFQHYITVLVVARYFGTYCGLSSDPY